MSRKTITERVTRLEAWVEAVMLVVSSIDVEALLTELDEARGADYGEEDESCAAE
jgi:hypothetical protein